MHLKLIEWIISGLIPPPKLVYRAAFGQGGPHILVNTIDAADRLWVATTAAGQNAQPPQGPLQPLSTDGLDVSITKSATDANVVVHVGLSPFPPSLRRFTLIAQGEFRSFAPSSGTEQWAATLVVRDGERTTIASTNKLVGATHQVRGGGNVALGLAQGVGTSQRVDVPIADAYPDRTHRPFRLEADMDLHSGRGWSRLRTPGFTWPERSWTFPFIVDPADPSAVPLTAIGVGIGMVAGTGTPGVTFYDLAIYRWTVPKPWWYPFVSRYVDWYADTPPRWLLP